MPSLTTHCVYLRSIFLLLEDVDGVAGVDGVSVMSRTSRSFLIVSGPQGERKGGRVSELRKREKEGECERLFTLYIIFSIIYIVVGAR